MDGPDEVVHQPVRLRVMAALTACAPSDEGLDFTQLKQVVRGIIKRLDHQFINDLEPFTTVNPSAENMAKYFYDAVTGQLTGLPPGAHVTHTIIWETDTACARYSPRG